MGLPIPSFTAVPLPGLEVSLTDTSDPNGSPITSYQYIIILDSASVVFFNEPTGTVMVPQPGIYAITLLVINEDGQSASTQIVTVTEPGYGGSGSGSGSGSDGTAGSILSMVCCKVPLSLCGGPCQLNYIKKWQYYLNPQLSTPLTTDTAIEDEDNWPYLWRVLIAELAVYDIILAEATKWMASGNLMFDPNNGTANTSVKTIKTGPSEAEWWDNQKNQALFFKTMFTEKGALMQYKSAICDLAKRLKAFIPFCGQEKRVIPFIKAMPQVPDKPSELPSWITN